MPEATDLFVFFAWILGGFVSGVSGIGGAMVAFPLLALVIPVHQLIALTCIINVVMDGCLAGMHFRHCRLSSLWPMLAGSVPGSFAGLYILQICSGAVLQGAVGLLLLYYVYWQMTYRAAQGPVSHPRMLGAAAGFGAGLLGTAISFDGPPIGAYGLCMGWEPRVFLGTLGVFFVIRGSLTVILQATAGFYTPEVLGYALYGAPGVILGTLLAFPVAKRIPQETFRKVLLVIIGVWCGRWARRACAGTAGCVPLGPPGWASRMGKRGDAARGRGLRSSRPPGSPAPRRGPGAVVARRDGRHRAFGARRQTARSTGEEAR